MITSVLSPGGGCRRLSDAVPGIQAGFRAPGFHWLLRIIDVRGFSRIRRRRFLQASFGKIKIKDPLLFFPLLPGFPCLPSVFSDLVGSDFFLGKLFFFQRLVKPFQHHTDLAVFSRSRSSAPGYRLQIRDSRVQGSDGCALWIRDSVFFQASRALPR